MTGLQSFLPSFFFSLLIFFFGFCFERENGHEFNLAIGHQHRNLLTEAGEVQVHYRKLFRVLFSFGLIRWKSCPSSFEAIPIRLIQIYRKHFSAKAFRDRTCKICQITHPQVNGRIFFEKKLSQHSSCRGLEADAFA